MATKKVLCPLCGWDVNRRPKGRIDGKACVGSRVVIFPLSPGQMERTGTFSKADVKKAAREWHRWNSQFQGRTRKPKVK